MLSSCKRQSERKKTPQGRTVERYSIVFVHLCVFMIYSNIKVVKILGEPDQKYTVRKAKWHWKRWKNEDLTIVAGIPSNSFNVFQEGKIKVHQHILLKERNLISTTFKSEFVQIGSENKQKVDAGTDMATTWFAFSWKEQLLWWHGLHYRSLGALGWFSLNSMLSSPVLQEKWSSSVLSQVMG